MGLSVAIAGGIVMVTIMLVMLTIPNVVNNIFSIGEVSSQSSKVNDLVSKTDIVVETILTKVGSPRVNFTLNNQGSTTLWDFNNFNILIEYTGAASGKKTEQLSYDGECLGAAPPVGQWCIQSILNDIADPKLLNFGEKASVRTSLNENLASTNTIVAVATDTGVTFKTGNPSCGSGIPLPSCKKFGMVMPSDDSQLGFGLFEGITLVGADTLGDDSDGSRMTWVSGAVAGNNAGYRTTGTMTSSCHLEWNCYLDAKVQLTATAGSLMFVGFRSASGALGDNDTPCAGVSCAGFLIRSIDGEFQIVTNDGDAGQDLVASGVLEDLNVHRFEVRADAANNRFGFKIDDGSEIFVSAEIPGQITDLARYVTIVNRDAVADSFENYYAYTENDK